jgi:hypothetical protein
VRLFHYQPATSTAKQLHDEVEARRATHRQAGLLHSTVADAGVPMDLSREQSQPGQAPSPPPAQHVVAPAVYAPPPPSRLVVLERLARLLLRRFARLIMQLWLLIRPRLGWLLLTTFLTGVIALLGLMLIVPRLISRAADDPGDARVALIQPADAVVDFLRGQQTYDADLMWEALSPELRSALEQQAVTRDALAEQVESERQAGHRYRSFEYVGGVEVEGRRKMFFYAVEIQSPVPERNGTFSFVFTVDQSGKIISVEM